MEIISTSPDGITWTERLDIVATPSNTFHDVAWGGGQFVAVGYYDTYSSADGIKWVKRASYFDGSERKGVVFGNGRFIAVANYGLIEKSGSIGKLGASLAPNGQFIGTLAGISRQTYSIQYSPRLGDWVPFTSVTISNGIGQFIDSSTNGSSRFYKVLPLNQ